MAVAGTAAATSNNGLGVAGIAGAANINVSYRGVSGSAAVQSAVRYRKSKGGLLFVSAGNGGIDENLVPDAATIAVSATYSNDVKTSCSRYGIFVSLAAPGAGIWTTARGGLYQASNGTSFASPLAAGARC